MENTTTLSDRIGQGVLIGIITMLLGLVLFILLHCTTYRVTEEKIFHTDEINKIYPFGGMVVLNNGVEVYSQGAFTLSEWGRGGKDLICTYRVKENIFGFVSCIEQVNERYEVK